MTETAVLQVEGLTRRFGDLVAVNNLSLSVQRGEIFGFLGPNGAGKTTSINMMCGLLRADSGQVLIHGQPVRGGDAEVRVRVGVCPQHLVLWENLTCIEQLTFVGQSYGLRAREARQRGDALLEAMGLAEKRNRLAKTLSGGMQRRLNLILALVHDPDIVVLDEPEAGLDPQSRILVREYVRSLARHKTVILTTHNMDEAERLADRVAIIDHGSLLALDTPAVLKRQVGEGDVLEITLDNGAEDALARAQRAVQRVLPDVSCAGQVLIIRARGIVEHLPAILSALEQASLTPGEVRLRAATLEDVFIALTGRRLRG